jgi:hypothetical protein
MLNVCLMKLVFISNFPGMKEKIEELAHIHEDRQTNLDYLYEAYRKVHILQYIYSYCIDLM